MSYTDPFFAVVNLRAGGWRGSKRARRALALLEHHGLQVEQNLAASRDEAIGLVAGARRAGRQRFLAVGGDGTLSAVVNGLLVGEQDGPIPQLGVLPTGTGNSFLRDFGIRTLPQAVTAAVQGTPRACDVMRLQCSEGPIYAVNILGTGLIPDIAGLRDRWFRHLGSVGYALAAALRILRPGFARRYDAGLSEPVLSASHGPLLALCNSGYTGGGMHIAPDAALDDGRLDIVHAGPLSRLRLIAALQRVYAGSHLAMPEVEHRQAAGVVFAEARRQPVLVDGEVLELRPQRAAVLTGRLQLLVD